MTNQVKLDAATTVATKMSKRNAASLVRFLTEAIATNPGYLIDVRIDLRNEFDQTTALISVDNNTMFGSVAEIVEARVIKYEEAK
jgi:hypothetical protein